MGVSSWLASGLAIEEAQYVVNAISSCLLKLSRIALRAHVRQLKNNWTSAEKLEVSKRRERLRNRIQSFNERALTYLRGINHIQLTLDEVEPLADEASDDDDDRDPFLLTHAEMSSGQPESLSLLLPSTIGRETCMNLGLAEIMNKEIALQEGQANDALEGLRQGIGEKSFLFREHVRLAEGIKQKTRARAAVQTVGRALNNHRRIYGFARRALIALGAEVESNSVRYKPVTLQDLWASTTIYNPGAPGQRNKCLAWFWGSYEKGDEDSLLTECESFTTV